MRNIQYLTIDINKKTQMPITANVGEVGSRFINIKILNNNSYVDLTGVGVFLYALKPDGTKVFNSVEVVSATQGIVLAELTSQILTKSGNVKLILVLIQNENKLISKEFVLTVEGTIFNDSIVESVNEFPALVKALGEVQDIDNKFTKVNEQFNTMASKQEVEVERQRINNFVSLKEGSTTGDAELIDVRIGANGLTYENAGNSVRGQFKSLKNIIDKTNNNIIKSLETSNIEISNLIWKKGFINSTGEETESSSNLINNEFYKVDTTKTYTIKATNSNGLIARCYDSGGVFRESISFVGNATPSVIVTKEWIFNYPLVRFVITTNNVENKPSENNISITYGINSIFAKKEEIPVIPKKPYVSPIDFGAKGDGTGDDSDAIQRCVNYCIENDVKLMCEKSYTFVISKTISFIGKDYQLTTGDGLVTRDVKRIATDFDFNNSTFYITGGITSDLTHAVSYNNVVYPCAIYYYNSDNFSMNGCIKNLRINCRKVAMIPIYCEQIRKSRFENIDIQGLSTVGFWLGFSSGSMFNNIVIKADVKGTTGFYVTSSDCHFTDIFMVDVTTPFDTLACMNYFTRVHPFILTPSFISGSRMFKCRSFDFDGTYKGSVTMVLTDCYCDTFEFCFDISDRKDHRIISKGLTYINNTTIMDNFFNQNGTTGLYLVKTGGNIGYASKVKIINSFMSGFVKDNIIHTYLSDTGEIVLDDFSVVSNIKSKPE